MFVLPDNNLNVEEIVVSIKEYLCKYQSLNKGNRSVILLSDCILTQSISMPPAEIPVFKKQASACFVVLFRAV